MQHEEVTVEDGELKLVAGVTKEGDELTQPFVKYYRNNELIGNFPLRSPSTRIAHVLFVASLPENEKLRWKLLVEQITVEGKKRAKRDRKAGEWSPDQVVEE